MDWNWFQKLREKSNIPIIISSARDDILDKVMGLERGADDYLKPYNPRELQARIKTILKRVDSKSNNNKISRKSNFWIKKWYAKYFQKHSFQFNFLDWNMIF